MVHLQNKQPLPINLLMEVIGGSGTGKKPTVTPPKQPAPKPKTVQPTGGAYVDTGGKSYGGHVGFRINF